MAFTRNKIYRIRFDDPLQSLTKEQRAYLDAGWAGYFAREIFPRIDESHFSPLYSANRRGRYNKPVNHLVGLLLIKDITGFSDHALLCESVLDLRYKYALCCTDLVDAPATAAALSRFRHHINAYKRKNGRDLLLEEYLLLKEHLAALVHTYKIKPRPGCRLYKVMEK